MSQGWIAMTFLRAYVLPVVLLAGVSCCEVMSIQAQANTEIGGQPIVTLKRSATSKTKPEFTSVVVAPGRGMQLLQITANFPGKGEVEVLLTSCRELVTVTSSIKKPKLEDVPWVMEPLFQRYIYRS